MTDQRYDALKLKNQLCFPLYVCSRELIKRYKPFLDTIGLTYTQYLTMLVLWEEGETTSKELGNRLYLDSGTLTPLLKKLEAKGYVSRTRSRKDERNLIVEPTEQGKLLRQQALEMPMAIEKYTELSREEAESLYRVLYKILARIDEMHEE